MTEEMCVDLDRGYARFKAHVGDGEGGMATGTGTETAKSFTEYVEKAETRAIGRALAALGIGTQFVGEELSEGEHVADSPLVSSNGHQPLATSGVGSSPGASHPTADEITTLVDTARAANGSNDDFAHDMRRLLKLPESQKITKKFLRETMTMAQYDTARAHYGEAPCQILNQDVPAFPRQKEPTDDPTAPQAAAAEPTHPAPDEGPAAVPSREASSSAAPESAHAADDATERDRQRLRQEVSTWDLKVSAKEIEHIITHHPYSRARQLLWQARNKASAATLSAQAAD
jgi:hypothetical protein